MRPYPLALAAVLAAGLAHAADDRPERLLAQMTLDEKIAQLHQRGGGEPGDPDPATRRQRVDELLALARSGAVGSYLGAAGAEHTNRLQQATLDGARLKIPALFAHDVIHGYRTIFPTPLAESCAWDPELAGRTAAVAAREARSAGVHWTFAPMVDIARDPRWGRIVEGSGEDPLLGAVLAAARVRGFQGADPAAPDRVLACAKHFAAYGAAEGGRDYNTAEISPTTLHQIYLPPFKAATDAGVASFMTAFNDIDGLPCSGSVPLMRDTLRTAWGFDGVVISDFTAISEMIAHGYAKDAPDAARLSLIAGVDIDMMADAYRDHLARLVRGNVIPESLVDESALRVLRLKAKAGLFDRPFADPALEAKTLLAPEHRALAREAAARSMVLLKNDKGLLPLAPSLKKIALVGPLADRGRDTIGTWACMGRGEEAVTMHAGLRALAERQGATLTYVPGCEPRKDTEGGLARAADAARDADLVIAVVGEEEMQTGEGHSRSMIVLPEPQQKLLEAVHATGKPLVVVLMIGRPLALPWVAEHAGAVLVSWHPGTEGGHALADVLSGAVNPSARLTTSFPRNPGQIPVHYNHKPTGRPNKPGERYTTGYSDVDIDPLYPFGFGLSYTTFELSPVRLASTTLTTTGAVAAELELRNTGTRRGAEVVQWYLRDPVASRSRPVKELVAFERVELDPGQSRTVRLELPAPRLAFLDGQGRPVLEPGEFRLHAAGGHARTPDVIFTLDPAR